MRTGLGPWVLLLAALALAGCQSVHSPRLAPLAAEVEEDPGNPARYLVLVNTSTEELHHCSYAAFLANETDPNPLLRLQPFARCAGTRAVWKPGEEARFQRPGSTLEYPILEPVSYVEVVGRCDEGSFRQAWRITEPRSPLRPSGVPAKFSVLPGVSGQLNPPLKP